MSGSLNAACACQLVGAVVHGLLQSGHELQTIGLAVHATTGG